MKKITAFILACIIAIGLLSTDFLAEDEISWGGYFLMKNAVRNQTTGINYKIGTTLSTNKSGTTEEGVKLVPKKTAPYLTFNFTEGDGIYGTDADYFPYLVIKVKLSRVPYATEINNIGVNINGNKIGESNYVGVSYADTTDWQIVVIDLSNADFIGCVESIKIYLMESASLDTPITFIYEYFAFLRSEEAVASLKNQYNGDIVSYVNSVPKGEIPGNYPTKTPIPAATRRPGPDTPWPWQNELDISGDRTTSPGQSSILVENASYTWWNNKQAIRYVDKKDQTYISHATESGGICITSYDHNTGNIQTSVLAQFNLVDDHNSPGLAILPDGRILAVYSRHNADTKLRWKVSTNAEDITSFSEEKYVECNKKVTYAQIYRISYEEYRVFYRAVTGWATRVYNWVYDEWSDEVRWIEEKKGSQYYLWVQEDVAEGRLNIFMTGHPKGGYDQNIRFGYFDADSNICKLDGTVIGNLDVQASKILTPRDFTDIVYEASENEHTRLYDMTYMSDKMGVLYGVGVGTEDTSKYYYAYYDQETNTWIKNLICDSGKWLVAGNMYFGGISYDRKDMQTIYVSRREGDVCRLEKWHTDDYGATWKIVDIIDEAASEDIVVMRPISPYNAHDDIDVIYIKGTYPSYSTFNTELMIYGDEAPATPTQKPTPNNTPAPATPTQKPTPDNTPAPATPTQKPTPDNTPVPATPTQKPTPDNTPVPTTKEPVTTKAPKNNKNCGASSAIAQIMFVLGATLIIKRKGVL
ncbi:MAG: hypothetical protein E7385_02925 [Ruminococcaceae bacterium]|nr:hypothetical protein [Oscillospiraceae bacterium]